MAAVKSVLVMLLTVFWTVAGAHCALEVLPGMEFLHCQSAAEPGHAGEPHCDDNACMTIESGLFLAQFEPAIVPLVVYSQMVVDSAATEPLPARDWPQAFRVAEPRTAPRPWQFFMRTARPPRAPSMPAS
jgi:hypothetical protein